MRRGTFFRPSVLLALILLALVGVGCGGDGEGGLRLVFHSDRGGDDDIYIMEADGSGVRQLTDEPGRDYEAESSHDGRTLVFVSDRAGEDGDQLYLMDVDGSDVRRLTFSAGAGGRVVDDYPHWSPDGRRIAFQRTTIPEGGGADADLWLIDVESGEETQLTDTPDAWDSTPSFAADGNSVLFESNRDGDFDVYRLELETMQIVQLTDEEGTDAEAKESPDGRQVAFASGRDGGFDIYVMDADGGSVRRLTENDTVDRCPHWSPDGRQISFYSERDGNREIYLMEADGGQQRRLTDNPSRDEVPNWVDGP